MDRLIKISMVVILLVSVIIIVLNVFLRIFLTDSGTEYMTMMSGGENAIQTNINI